MAEELPHCPGCGEDALVIEERMVSQPLGSFSLSGAQMKVAARRVPFLRCAACGIETEGKVA